MGDDVERTMTERSDADESGAGAPRDGTAVRPDGGRRGDDDTPTEDAWNWDPAVADEDTPDVDRDRTADPAEPVGGTDGDEPRPDTVTDDAGATTTARADSHGSVLTDLHGRMAGPPPGLASPRRRRLFGRYATVLLIGGLLIAAAGGAVVYAEETAPATTTETDTVATWTADAEFEHAAVVTNDTSVFESGERLTDRPVYFSELTPVLEANYVIEHDGTGADAVPATGTADLRLVYRATEEVDGEEVVHWERTEPLASESIEELEPGETRRVGFEINTSAIDDTLSTIESELGASPGSTEVVVEAETVLETELADEPATAERDDRLTIETGSTYRVSEAIDDVEPTERTETTTVPVERSNVRLFGGSIAVVVGLLTIGLIGYARWRGWFRLTPTERERVDFESARRTHDKWISPGTVPDDDRTVVTLATLGDLVDVAIDSDRRVIERQDGRTRYDLIVGDTRYVYTPPSKTEASETTRPEDDADTRPPVDDGDVPRATDD